MDMLKEKAIIVSHKYKSLFPKAIHKTLKNKNKKFINFGSI